MIHAYDKNYLLKAQNTLGAMFDFVAYSLNMNLSDFYKKFLCSKVSSEFETGNSAIIAGKSGVEIATLVLGDEKLSAKYKPSQSRSHEFWAGWALAYFQWETNLPFHRIEKYIPLEEIIASYNPYHEMDIAHFCEMMAELYNTRKKMTNLKLYRLNAALSQSELAQISGIPLRTIQQYEQGNKNINAAKAESVISLAKALTCSAEDLLEIRF